MRKTKFKVDILSHGTENEYLLKIIAHHNEGLANVCLADFISWGVMRTALYPSLLVSIERHLDDDSVLIVTDNGKRILIIKEIEVHELVEANDLKDINVFNSH